MAGSSMDGLDLSYVVFEQKENEWHYNLGKCETIEYPQNFYERLKESPTQNKGIQEKLDEDFGEWIAKSINEFMKGLPPVDLPGVHGHTVAHNPKQKISWQLGSGEVISSKLEIPTVTDFRSKDINYGGQGAPLVPYGDFTLFNQYDACLNLGGIANISIKESKTAWDICPCNQVLNFFAAKLGSPFDADGFLARSGNFNSSFHSNITSTAYFNQAPPKSLPNNFLDSKILDSIDPKDGLNTYCDIIAELVQKSLSTSNGSKLLITGGGTFNGFLIGLIRQKLKAWDVHIPGEKLVAFKESLVFAFLALKRLRNEINILSSVTGASKDTCSGVIHLP